MSTRSLEERSRDLINQFGRTAAHYLFPNDIEFYFCALELVDVDGRTVQYFAFPIMPKGIIYNDSEITKTYRTFGGITTLRTNTFDIKNYTLQGNFGRNFKILVGGRPFQFAGLDFNFGAEGIQSSRFRIEVPEMSVTVKNGYGCIKVMERIIKSADQLDEQGRPYKLFFYNTSLNHQYLVEPQDFTFNQSLDMNMIWNYNLRLKCVAKLEDLVKNRRGNLVNSLALAEINKGANALGRKLVNSLV